MGVEIYRSPFEGGGLRWGWKYAAPPMMGGVRRFVGHYGVCLAVKGVDLWQFSHFERNQEILEPYSNNSQVNGK